MKKIVLVIVAILLICLAYFLVRKFWPKNQTPDYQPVQETSFPAVSEFALPTLQFKERITKKPFGIYVSPKNSPVQPERFIGYHTAVDIEYEDVSEDVPVYSIGNSVVKIARTASGYGGVAVLETEIKNKKQSVVYGHLRPVSLPKVGQEFKKGDQIGVLGTGYSQETDGERKHLHFGILSDNRIDLLGYVQTEEELSGWIDPLTLYN